MPKNPSDDADRPENGDIAIVHAWHDALNSGDLDRLTALMHDDVAFGGPRGEGRGAALVRDWTERSGIRLTPDRWFQRNGVVVVAQRAQWPDPDTGGLTPPDDIASVFEVRDGLVQRVIRYGSLHEALAVVGFDETADCRSPPREATG
jgi:ketosteroid isomerase-like protein